MHAGRDMRQAALGATPRCLTWLYVLVETEQIIGILGIWWPFMGIAAGIGLVVYFVGAIVSHVPVGDVKGIRLVPSC